MRLRTRGAGATVAYRSVPVGRRESAPFHASAPSLYVVPNEVRWHVKDTHLIIALYRALDRYGSTSLPDDDGARSERKRGGAWHEERRRSPGWVSVSEIESSQSPNTYPRLTRRAIRQRCEALSGQEGSPVQRTEKGSGGLRTWVLVAPPGERRKTPRDEPEYDERDVVTGDARKADPHGADATGDAATDAGAEDEEPSRSPVPAK